MIARATKIVLLALALGVLPARAEDGATVYKARCALCHGDVAAPVFARASVDEVKAAVAQGKGKMAAMQLTPDELEAVARFTARSGKNQPWYGTGP